MIYNNIYVVIFDYTCIIWVPGDITFLCHLSCAHLGRECEMSPLNFLNIEKTTIQMPFLSA